MGLAGRKQKQRIPTDPRNLSWADDASRFGLSYLSKFGWDASKGLGSSGDGMKTHLKVQQKLDMMGIGAQHQRDPNGITWKQNKEFEALLKRLNESAEQGRGNKGENEDEKEKTAIDTAFVRAEEKVDEKLENESSVTTKKRRHEDGDDPVTIENKRKEQKRKEKRQKSGPCVADAPNINLVSKPLSAPSSSKPHSEPTPQSRPMAHRVRIRAAKRMAGKSASAIAEILGIAPSSSVSTSTPTPAPTPPSSSTPVPQPVLALDSLITSTKSVADYFKEKLSACSPSSSSLASSSVPSGSTTPGLSPPDVGEGELPRRGISSRAAVPADSLWQVPEAGSISARGSQNTLTEKQRRKAERKAKKRKCREAQASETTSEGVSTSVKEEIDTERSPGTSKKEKKQKDPCEQQEPAPADRSNDNDIDTVEKRHSQDTLSGPLPEPEKHSERERKQR